MKEGAPTILESEPKAISVEREDGSISVQLSKELQEKEGMIFTVASMIESVVKDGLFEVILDIENGSLEVRCLNQDQEVPEEIKTQIEDELAKLDTVF